MLQGLYLSAQGADVQSKRLDVLSNNLANASSTAFKRDLAVFQTHRPFDVEQGNTQTVSGNLNDSAGGLSLAEVVTDFSDGPLEETNGRFDLALTGSGFFQVSDGQNEFLTRDGSFLLNTSGELITQETGLQVMGTEGPLNFPADVTDVDISRDGIVTGMFADGSRTNIGKLALAEPESYASLKKLGSGLFQTDGAVQPAGPELTVRQGFLEASTTRPVLEMMDLIQTSRAFEANINVIKLQEDSLGQLLQSMGGR
jgi:flagellar basal body rod protein FlgG